MNIEIQSRPFTLTPALVGAVQQQLATVCERNVGRIISVSVHLDDVNGTRGGVDKRCRIVVRMAPRVTLVGEALSEDLYNAIRLAARRAEAALEKRLGRKRFLRAPARSVAVPGVAA